MDGTPSGYGKHLRLPDSLRPELRIPLGRLVNATGFRQEVAGRAKLATVGDWCTVEALEASVRPRVAVVDLRVKRAPDTRAKDASLFEGARVFPVRNPAGTITPEAWRALEDAYGAGGPAVVHVEGEEDLLALPAIVLAPPGFVVSYGLPDRGAVLVEVTAEARGRAEAFLSRMEIDHGD